MTRLGSQGQGGGGGVGLGARVLHLAPEPLIFPSTTQPRATSSGGSTPAVVKGDASSKFKAFLPAKAAKG